MNKSGIKVTISDGRKIPVEKRIYVSKDLNGAEFKTMDNIVYTRRPNGQIISNKQRSAKAQRRIERRVK